MRFKILAAQKLYENLLINKIRWETRVNEPSTSRMADIVGNEQRLTAYNHAIDMLKDAFEYEEI